MASISSWNQVLYKRRALRPRQSTGRRAQTRSPSMCRVTFLAILCLGAATTAAQDSDGTFVKMGLLVGNDTRLNVTTNLGYSPERLSPLGPENTTDDGTTGPGDSEPTTESDGGTSPASPRTTSARSFTRPSPRFVSKLSYFNKANANSSSSISTNLVDRPDGDGKKRRFKSRCRCEKIWNCPKLQITVPRCPDEYFMCCF